MPEFVCGELYTIHSLPIFAEAIPSPSDSLIALSFYMLHMACKAGR